MKIRTTAPTGATRLRRSFIAIAIAGVLAATVAAPVSASTLTAPTVSEAASAVDHSGEPTPPPIGEPKPKKHPPRSAPSDEEPPAPGPGERITIPATLNLYKSTGFRYQDTNWSACTSTSAMNMLNFISIGGQGGSGFRWAKTLSATTRDSILSWERTHDTLAGGSGSDPHGWRNALNYYGWGSAALTAGSRVYDDFAYSSYDRAIKAAVRALIRYHKPVGLAAWQGRHAQMLTGYDDIVGDPFARDLNGVYTNAFKVGVLYVTDPLGSSALVNRRLGYSYFRTTTNARIRFQPYYETDSPYDDPYTAGTIRARDEWYGRWVIVAPIR